MKVAFCSSEVFPFAKTGGLADVSGALPWALADEGCEIKVFMPLYKNIKPQILNQYFGVSKVGKVEVIFVRNDNYFLRDALYGTPKGDYPDNLERFSFFNNQVIEIMKKINFNPDIVHCNDWQTAPLIIFLRTKYKDVFKNAKLVLTIHNLAYQGIFPQDKFSVLGISGEYFSIQYLEFYGKINLLKGGIVFADMVNTVSPTYAKQIQTQEFGCGLEGVLREKKDRLMGILNAIDYSVWDPSKDKFIYKNYSSRNLDDKYINKNRFQKELGLAEKKNTLLLGMVSRLAEQKGIDILSKGLEKILKKYQVIILGLGEKKYHKILQDIEKGNKKSFVLFLKFDEELAHKIYASCDCFLLPSRFEPCGLSQMISYRYATVPIVHHTGGLADTVVDYSDKGGGFVFKNYSEIDLINTIDRAKEVFDRKDEWLKLLKKITKYNFSWKRTAKEYINMYRIIL
ncbi:MAG: glycogen synthase [Candidatus Omnitrophica bacterium]|nr:glycogen synthase [Candidatus Omnitrophota bacterium]